MSGEKVSSHEGYGDMKVFVQGILRPLQAFILFFSSSRSAFDLV